MNRLKEFASSYLTGFLSVLIVLNVIIVLFGLMGIGWDKMLDVPTYLLEGFKDPTHYFSRSNATPGTNSSTKTIAGLVSSSDIKLVSSDETFAAALSKVRPAIVNISCETIGRAPAVPGNLRFDDPALDLSSLGGIGSGIIVHPAGYILTCLHIVSRASNITVTPFGYAAKPYPADIIGKDEGLNLALLRINTGDALPVATLGDSSQMEAADFVLAIGSPFGLEQSVTHGIISDTARDIVIDGITYRGMMQTDVPINRGSSGGPLINVSGEIIAVNMAIYAPTGVYSGVSFAMPINRVKGLLAKTIKQG